MNKRIQEEINSNKQLEWIEKHDKLIRTEKAFDEKNQYDWWKQNCLIRDAFDSIGKEIKISLEKGDIPSSRAISLTKIAKLAGCSRTTLLHEKRRSWVYERREKLLNLLTSDHLVDDESEWFLKEHEKRMLKEKLQASRNECAKWVKKTEELQKNNTKLEKKLYYKEGVLKKQREQIRELRLKLSEIEESENGKNVVEFPIVNKKGDD